MHFRPVFTSLCVIGLGVCATPASFAASFNDGFDAAGDVANQYSYFIQDDDSATPGDQNLTGELIDSLTATNGTSFTLDTANSQVDFVVTPSTAPAFNQASLSRSVDTANHYDLTQATSLTLEASGLDTLFFNSVRNPVTFGFGAGDTNPGITVSIQQINFSPDTRITVKANNVTLAGGDINASEFANGAYTLNIDADSYSLAKGATLLIADTLHGLTFEETEGAVPFFGSQLVFGSTNTDLSVDGFAGTGTTAVPEPTSLLLLGFAGCVALSRRRL